MSEEEKKAIKYLNGIIEINNIKIKNIEEKGDVSLTGLGTMHDVYKLQNLNYILVLNLIEKQQKEIRNGKEYLEELLQEEKEKYKIYKNDAKENENLKWGMYKHLGAVNILEKILGKEKNVVCLDSIKGE